MFHGCFLESSGSRKSLDLIGGAIYQGGFLCTYSEFKPTGTLLTFQPKSQSKGFAARWVTCEVGSAQPSEFQIRSLRLHKPFLKKELLTKQLSASWSETCYPQINFPLSVNRDHDPHYDPTTHFFSGGFLFLISNSLKTVLDGKPKCKGPLFLENSLSPAFLTLKSAHNPTLLIISMWVKEMNVFFFFKSLPGLLSPLLRISELCLKCSWPPSLKGLHCFSLAFALHLQKYVLSLALCPENAGSE